LTAAHTLFFFSVFIINISSFVFFCLSQGNVCEYHTFHYYTHIRYFSFFLYRLYMVFLLYPGTVFWLFFFFFRQNLNLFNMFWFLYSCSERPDLSFVLLFSFIKSQFFFSSFFLLLFARFSLFICSHQPNYMYY
jgi:hypothetical protein